MSPVVKTDTLAAAELAIRRGDWAGARMLVSSLHPGTCNETDPICCLLDAIDDNSVTACERWLAGVMFTVLR